MTVQGLEQAHEVINTDIPVHQPTGPYFLACPYCNWTSLDVGIQFEKANNITGQLAKLQSGTPTAQKPETKGARSERRLTSVAEVEEERQEEQEARKQLTPEEMFSNLAAFYKSQMPESSSYGYDFGVGSPSSLARIMSMYTGLGSKKSRREKPHSTRDAESLEEGLKVFDYDEDEKTIQKIAALGLEGLTTQEQRDRQLGPAKARFVSDLRPVPTLIRTKRSKRCRACRHILARPDNKVQSTRWKIRLLALNYIPKISLAPLISNNGSGNASQAAPSAGGGSVPAFGYDSLQPLKPIQFLLTLRNPLYDPIRVTLATPATTPGKVSSRVTVLCPQFDIGANTDVWDEALNAPSAGRDRRQPSGLGVGSGSADAAASGQAEAGKVWERGRNWTTVILELVPGAIPIRRPVNPQRSLSMPGGLYPISDSREGLEESDEDEAVDEDDAVLEIPVFVRYEYETDPTEEGANAADVSADKDQGQRPKEKREGAYWCVLGVGRIQS